MEGAAISTLVSRIFCAVVVIYKLRSEEEPIFIKNYAAIRPDFSLIKKILFIGIPSGIENSMFQFGKLAIQSTVSTLGTVAIAAQAMTNILENLNGVAATVSALDWRMWWTVSRCRQKRRGHLLHQKTFLARRGSDRDQLSYCACPDKTNHPVRRHGSGKC